MIELLLFSLVISVTLLLWYLDRVLDKNRELKKIIKTLLDDSSPKRSDIFTMEAADSNQLGYEHVNESHGNSTKDEGQDITDKDARKVHRVLAFCQYCEGFLSDDADHFDIDIFHNNVKKAIGFAQDIDDEFFRDTAYHQIVVLLARAGLSEQAKRVLSRVSIEMIRERTIEDLEKYSLENELIDRVGGGMRG